MCGIALARGVRDAERVVAAMSRGLAHRGPDDDGIAPLHTLDGEPYGAMAHRRLSILDLSSAGHQPMASSDGRWLIAFNGEIYNFRELRAELEREGALFASSGDTAVLLEGWSRHGPEFVDRLEGMFAFAIWDRHTGELHLARDAFGIKPLYFASVGGGVLVASEVRAILASGLVPPRIDRAALAGYLMFGSVCEPLTMISGIHAVPPGEVIRCNARGTPPSVIVRFSMVETPDRLIRDGAEASRVVRRALERSIDRHLVSDVPVAVFLSGGIDSSVVTALAAHRAGTSLDGFTVTFADQQLDESAIAATVARRYGIRHHQIPLGDADLLGALPGAFAAMDQPSLDGINTYVVSKAVRERGIRVVLSGLGGDELFAGYPSFRRAKALARYSRLPGPARQIAARVATRVGGLRGAKIALGLRKGSPADAAYLASRVLFSESRVVDLCGTRPWPTAIAPRALTVLQQVSWHETTGYMRDTLLRDSDVFSMAHGLELRVPFVDREVASAAFSIADSLKLSRGTTKPLLVDAVRDLLPREVWDRPKQGFVLPFAQWMRGPMAAEVGSALGDAAAVAMAGLDRRAVGDVWNGFVANQPGMTWSRPWALYALVRWAAAVGIDGLVSDLPDEPEALAG
jgi:asparagine synthase (glutamine-hydrolysing)